MRLYVDSNVIISYINQEFGGKFEVMDYRVEQFFAICIEDKHKLIISDLTVKEISAHTYLSKNEVLDFLEGIGLDVGYIEYLPQKKRHIRDHIRKRKEIQRVHRPDDLHVAFALEAKADCIVTWNKKDFEPVEKLIDVYSPDEFI